MTVAPSLQIECRQLKDALTKLDDWLGDRRAIDPAIHTILTEDVACALAETAALAEATERPPAIGLLGPITAQADRIVAALMKPRDARPLGQFEASHVRLPVLTGLLPKRSDADGGNDFGLAAIVRISRGDPADAAAKATETVVRLMQPSDDSAKRGLDASVRISLLSLADIIKILARTFFANVAQVPSPTVTTEIVAALELAAGENLSAATQPGLAAHTVADIRAYLTARFRRHPVMEALEAAGYWDAFAALAPRATAEGRRRIVSLLWGGLADFDALYGSLSQALEALNFAGDVLAPADAVRESETGRGNAHSKSVLAAATLLDLLDDVGETVSVRSRFGQPVALPRAVVAALAREMRLLVEGDVSSVVGRADLLVLPSTCPAVVPRQASDRRTVSGETARPWLAGAVLQAKSVYLAEQATIECDLTGLVLLVEPHQPLSDAFAPVVSQWVGKTQGQTPTEREAVETGLFIAVGSEPAATGGSAPDKGAAIAWPALGAFMRDFEASGDWLQRWSSDLPFDNVFILGQGRPTLAAAEPKSPSSGSRELATLETTADIDGGLWLRHVRNTAVALDEALNTGDGGTGYLVQSIGAIAYERAKRRQIAGRLADVRRRMTDDISRFIYAANAAPDSDWRHRAALSTQAKLRLAVSNQSLGQVIDALAIGERSLRWTFERVLAEAARRVTTATNSGTHSRPNSGPQTRTDVDVAASSVHDGAAWIATRFGRLAVEQWLRAMRVTGAAAALAGPLGSTTYALSHLVDEMAIAAVRADIAGRIGAAVSRILTATGGSPALQASQAALVASEAMRQHIAMLGFDTPWSPLHPKRRGTLGAPLFERAAISDAAAIANAPAARFTLQYCSDWCEAFTVMTDDNIASARGTRSDEGEFRELDHLLVLLGHNVREATP